MGAASECAEMIIKVSEELLGASVSPNYRCTHEMTTGHPNLEGALQQGAGEDLAWAREENWLFPCARRLL